MDIQKFINIDELIKGLQRYGSEGPIDHTVIDNFFTAEIAEKLEQEFPSFDSHVWHKYENALELKKTCNNWNAFPALTYSVFSYLNSRDFLSQLEGVIKVDGGLYSDNGLNGGGWHIHCQGGKLNTHLDYSIHPKLMLQRKLNIIIYLNSSWRDDWGGALGIWGNESSEYPGELKKEIAPCFNRAVLFDTTQNSWHGLPKPLTCPEDQFRKSLAAYFLCKPPVQVDQRGKALFAPTEDQRDQDEVLELIKRRASVDTAVEVYRS
ncbi:proline hydroxylase (plasmid) [Sphingobium sp. LB126]|uniref:2OG-Fe(II) oxygenase n=1 Tax=Sphingobium sp. LB126 TaxID=1983755 RepID=UPI000C208514|nr:2OG-Fe(II) oxygenase [Sphingobium sp. LB126]PJG45164.1 proline hydroxylase [Sphingobium sp. LB126]